MSAPLKPCPFCGGTEKLRLVTDGCRWHWIACDDCSVRGPDERRAEHACDAWNTRSVDGFYRLMTFLASLLASGTAESELKPR